MPPKRRQVTTANNLKDSAGVRTIINVQRKTHEGGTHNRSIENLNRIGEITAEDIKPPVKEVWRNQFLGNMGTESSGSGSEGE